MKNKIMLVLILLAVIILPASAETYTGVVYRTVNSPLVNTTVNIGFRPDTVQASAVHAGSNNITYSFGGISNGTVSAAIVYESENKKFSEYSCAVAVVKNGSAWECGDIKMTDTGFNITWSKGEKNIPLSPSWMNEIVITYTATKDPMSSKFTLASLINPGTIDYLLMVVVFIAVWIILAGLFKLWVWIEKKMFW